MTVYLKKTKSEILSQALAKLTKNTEIKAVGPGSVVRSIVESVTSEIGDLYDILDFNVAQSYLSTATGASLDAIGSVYGVERKQVSDAEVIDKALGSFLFYIDSPHTSDILIPQGTNVYTSAVSIVGRQYSFTTANDAVLIAGRVRTYVSLRPNFVDNVFTAGPDSLIVHDAQSPEGVTLQCRNPKAISPQPAFESDNEYRIRIIKQIRVNAAGTSDAVRFAGLSAPQVRDIRIRQNPYGMGSFEAIIVPENVTNTNAVIQECRNRMEAVRPLGSRMFTKQPERLTVDLSVNIFLPGATDGQSGNSIVSRATIGLRRYLSGLLPGDRLIYNRLIQTVFDSSNLISDVSISSMSINGQAHSNQNYTPNSDEQIVVGNIVVKIASS